MIARVSICLYYMLTSPCFVSIVLCMYVMEIIPKMVNYIILTKKTARKRQCYKKNVTYFVCNFSYL